MPVYLDGRDDTPDFFAPDMSVLRVATWNELQLRERLAHDPIARLMRAWGIVSTAVRFVDVDDDDDELPFADPREVTE